MEVPRYWRTNSERLKQYKGPAELCSYTIQHATAAGFENQVPLIIGLIQLSFDRKIVAQLTDVDPNEVEVGMQLEMVTRKLREDGESGRGIIIYGPKFRPTLSKNTVE